VAPAADSSPFFTVIISTRNRPVLFRRALDSVVQQGFADREIFAIVDGCDEEYLQAYHQLEQDYDQVSFLWLQHRADGHGQSYTMNHGVAHSGGRYLCFLDDDDHWTDNDYLQRAHACIVGSQQTIDVHYSNQRAFYADGSEHAAPLWLEDLVSEVEAGSPHINDSFYVDADFLLLSEGFAHLNCSIFSRDFYQAIGGMDESIRYENDRDIFLRSIDAADVILYSTRVMSRHNIPDGTMRLNMSTAASAVDKKLYQIRVFDKGICHCKHPSVLQRCRLGKTYELKHLTELLVNRSDYARAAFYAREALTNGFNLRWLGYTLFLSLRSLVSREPVN